MTVHRRLEVAAISHVGLSRPGNQDALAVDGWTRPDIMYVPIVRRMDLDRPVLLAVSDGMGGRPCGEVASRIVIQSLTEAVPTMVDAPSTQAAIEAVNAAITGAAAENPERTGMGATVVGVVLRPSNLIWFNVGDSRLYRLRSGFLRRISIDDVPVSQEPQDGLAMRASHRITAWLGGERTPEGPKAHIGVEPIPAQGCWLLCSDGLTDVVDLARMEAMMAAPPLEAVCALFDAAMRGGAPDNISIIAARTTP